VIKLSKIVKEAQELVENGFDYVTDVEGFKLFRKRKWGHKTPHFRLSKAKGYRN
jgi:hypothetical protein